MRESEYTESARDDLIELKELKYDSASTGEANRWSVDVSSRATEGWSFSELLTGKVSLSFRERNSKVVLDPL